MPSDAQITFSLADIGQTCYPAAPQTLAQAIIDNLTGVLPGNYTAVVVGAALPSVDDQDKLWARLNSDGSLEGVYYYLGSWRRPHPVPPSSSFRTLWVGSESALWAADGGDGDDPSTTPPTDTTGAMWEVDTDFAFRIPIGVGTNGTAYDGNPATSVAVGANLGAEQQQLTDNQIAHDHALAADVLSTTAPSTSNYAAKEGNFGTSDPYYRLAGTATAPTLLKSEAVGADPTDRDYVSNLPPVRGVFIIKRTSRKDLVAA